MAIHQPNFMPWLGYFDKLARCDVFIVLDNVQFPKTGGTWINRVKILVNGQPAWMTVPVERSHHGVRNIRDVRISDARPWRSRLTSTVRMAYRHAPSFEVVFPLVARWLADSSQWLAEYNMHALRSMASMLEVDTSKIVSAASLSPTGSGTDLLISLVRSVRGDAYMCGGGASGYQEDEKFAKAGLELVYQGFEHPTYPQFNSTEFVAGLSIVDVLMNCGFEGTSLLLRGTHGSDYRRDSK